MLTVIRSRVVRDCTSFRRCALLGCYAACVDVCIKVSVYSGTNVSGSLLCPIIRVCLGRDQRFGTAFVSQHQGLFGQGPTFRDRFCVPASGSVWAGTNVSGPLVCPSIRVCLGRDQRFGIAFVSQHQGLFGQGQTLRDRLCVLSSGSHLMTLIMGHTSGPERLVPDQKTTPGKNSKTFIQHVICGKSLQWHILRVVY